MTTLTMNDANSLAASTSTTRAPTRAGLWTGRILTGVAIAFLTFDAVAKLLKLDAVVEGTQKLGYSPDVIVGLGTVLLLGVVLYAVPATAVFGAVVLTGYLGGAVATHVRVGNPLFTHSLFPIYVGILIWGGLYLRDARVRALVRPRPRA